MGLPCPRRIQDGKGCTFCDGTSFLPEYLFVADGERIESVEQQLEKGRYFFLNRLKVSLFYGYFQANTSTYGNIEYLLESYEIAMRKEYIVGIVISTRPDYIYPEILEGIQRLAQRYGKEVWIELGLQSVYDETLVRIHRGHTYQQFCEAVRLIRSVSLEILICVHMILGLPGENPEKMIAGTEKLFADNPLFGVKYRILDFEPRALISREREKTPEDFFCFTDESYVKLICDLLERIPPEVVILRFANFKSFVSKGTEEANYTKGTVIRKVEREFQRRGTRQGMRCRLEK